MKKFLTIVLSLVSLLACSDKMDLAEQKMQEIAGDYLMTSLSDRTESYLAQLPAAEREAIQHARLAKSPADDTWYFEYTLPVHVSGLRFNYFKISQEIRWEPAFGSYFTGLLIEKELGPTGHTAEDVSLELKADKITFWFLEENLACVWKKQ